MHFKDSLAKKSPLSLFENRTTFYLFSRPHSTSSLTSWVPELSTFTFILSPTLGNLESDRWSQYSKEIEILNMWAWMRFWEEEKWNEMNMILLAALAFPISPRPHPIWLCRQFWLTNEPSWQVQFASSVSKFMFIMFVGFNWRLA